MSGYIKDYRKELDSNIWLMPPLYHRVWQWIKYNVNHRAVEIPFADGTKVLVGPGERITSHRQIAKGVGYYERGVWREPNPKTVKEILNWLENEKMVSVTSNSQYTHLKVLNWEVYQGSDIAQSNSQETVNKQSLDTNKNDKNEKNDIKHLSTEKEKSEIPKRFIETFAYPPNLTQLQMLNSFLDDGLTEWHILEALKLSAEGGAKSPQYTKVILQDWLNKEAFTKEDVAKLDQIRTGNNKPNRARQVFDDSYEYQQREVNKDAFAFLTDNEEDLQ